jgi:glucose-6-phosphate 1-dehydrogenase
MLRRAHDISPVRNREETRRRVALRLHRIIYFFAVQPQLFPQVQESLQRQGAAHVQRSASPPHPQSVA